MTGPVREPILVVDDEALCRAVVTHILYRAGYRTLEADGVNAALACCAGTAVAAVVCDLAMEDGSGLDLLAHLRTSGSPLPFILVTGVGDESLRRDERFAGVEARLTKPVGSRELLACVDRVLTSAAGP